MGKVDVPQGAFMALLQIGKPGKPAED